MHRKIALVSLVIVLGLVNWSIIGKEKHLAEGRIVYLDLAPVDPRSLMQGDYMALHFRLADEVYQALLNTQDEQQLSRDATVVADNYVVVSLDGRNIGSFKYLYSNQPLTENEIRLRYRLRNGTVRFATNSFFFQEGHGEYYAPARYGQFRVDDKGELLLTAMYDQDLKKLKPKRDE